MNFGSQGGVPNLFCLPAPVYAGTVPAGASNTAPMAAVRTRNAPAARVDKSETETAFRDRRLANYEVRLKQEGSVSPVPNAVASANAQCGIEHGQMVHLGADSVSNPLRVGETVSPWTHHQERTRRLSACPEQPSVGGHYMGESVPRVSAWSVPRYDKTSYDDNYQPGFHAQSYADTHGPSLAHPGVTRGYQERPSCRVWYEASNRPAPASLPRHGELGVPQQPIVNRGPVRPYPQVRWLKCRTFKVMEV